MFQTHGRLGQCNNPITFIKPSFRIALLLACIALFTANRTRPHLFPTVLRRTNSKPHHNHHIALVCMFQNESPYLLEWIAHHATLGVSHFYLYDHLSTDDSNKTLAPLVRSGLVTLTTSLTALSQIPNFNLSLAQTAEQHKLATQLLTLHHFHLFYAHRTTFALTIDIDEFLVIHDGYTLRGVLDAIAAPGKGVGGVHVERLPFTTGGRQYRIGRDELATTTYLERLADSKLVHGRGKIIYRSDMRNESIKHLHRFNGCEGTMSDAQGRRYNGSTEELVQHPVVIVHHLTRSYGECEQKRGLSRRYSGGWRHRVSADYCLRLHRGSARFHARTSVRDGRIAHWMRGRRRAVCGAMWAMHKAYCREWKCCAG